MHGQLLSPFRPGSSVLHRLPAAGKLAFVLAVVLLVVLLPRDAWIAYGAVGTAVIVLGLLSRLPPAHLLGRLLLFEPLAVGVALLALTQPDGVVRFVSMLVRSTLCLAWMVLLTSTTRFDDLLGALRRARLPSLLVTTLALLHRYLYVLGDELGRMLRARRSRTFRRGRTQTWRGSAQVAALLFVRSSERAERIYAAMRARGWKT